jgi:uncharacterized repeat protein (TIGR02543 family)
MVNEANQNGSNITFVSIGTVQNAGGTVFGDLTWSLVDGALTIRPTIPGTKVSMGAVGNGQAWRQYNTEITSAVIENGVASIADGAFFNCYNMRSIVIPNSVTSIGSDAFNYCLNLQYLTLPNNLTSIGRMAFYDCCRLTSLNIPDSVTSIDYMAFASCIGLSSAKIPDGVTSINSDLFSHCNSLTSITIPDSVTSIENSAFYLTALSSITIPSSVTTIRNNVFDHNANKDFNAIYFEGNGNITFGWTESNYVRSPIPDDVLVVGYNPSGVYDYCVNTGTTSRFIPWGSSYTISYSANGGSFTGSAPASQTKTVGTPITLTSQIPVKDGYVFSGWSRSANFDLTRDVCYVPSAQYSNESTSNVTLYAVWTQSDPIYAVSDDPYNADNNAVSGYSSSKIGVNNNDSNKTWIKQSANWVEEGSTAKLRVDYAFDDLHEFADRDVVFIFDCSGSMGNSGVFGSMINAVADITKSVLDSSLNNRVAYVPIKDHMVTPRDFTADSSELLSVLSALHASGNENYHEGLTQALTYINNRSDKSRTPAVLFFSDGYPFTGEFDSNGIAGGNSAAALRAMGCPIAGVFYGDYNADVQRQFEGICTSPDMIFNAQGTGANLMAALKAAFRTLTGVNRTITIQLDTRYFETSATAPSGGNYGDSTVAISDNVITWNVTSLPSRQNYYIEIPLTFVYGDSQHSQGRGDGLNVFPTSKVGTDIAELQDRNTGDAINYVDTPVLTRGTAQTYTLRYVNHQGSASAATYGEVANLVDGESYTLPSALGYTGFVDGVPVSGTDIFSGWFTNKTASQKGALAYADAAERTITIGATADAADGATDGVITLYAGWVAPGSVTRDAADLNTSTTYQSGFNLEGVQIKSKDIPDEGVERANWQGATYNGMRFVTVYRNGLLTELDNLFKTGNPNYASASDTAITYGYMMYARDNITSLAAGSLKSGLDGAVDVDCTRDGNMNHKMFDAYRLSTIVVRYDSAEEQTKAVEARAYVNYVDANGFARRAYNTYTGSTFAGGCRAVYNDAYTALTRVSQ